MRPTKEFCRGRGVHSLVTRVRVVKKLSSDITLTSPFSTEGGLS
jgi:hypothetical protein